MVWVRYDDKFHDHEKILEVLDADPGALALHLVANTWSASSKNPGWVTAAAARKLVGTRAKKWAGILVTADLWHPDEFDGKPGWWIHDFEDYNPVSEEAKRRRSESARKAANARWHPDEPCEPDAEPHAERMRDASEPDAPTMPADAIARGRPEPVPPNSPTSTGSPPVPVGAASRVLRAYVEASRNADVPTPEAQQAKVSRSASRLLAEGYPEAAVTEAARNAAAGGWTDLGTQLQRDAARASPAAANGRPSTTDTRFRGALDLADQLDRKAIG